MNYGTATLTDCTISGNTAFSETTRKYYGYYGTSYRTITTATAAAWTIPARPT